MNLAKINTLKRTEDSNWLSIADLMSGLMFIFIFISVIYMKNFYNEKEAIKEIAMNYSNIKKKIYNSLNEEFESELKIWNAEILQDTLSIKFNNPKTLFERNDDRLNSGFKHILDDFFPRYINRLLEFRLYILSIRIEGHTSSEWEGVCDEGSPYFCNMKLSQNRTRSVLKYCLLIGNPSIKDHIKWLRNILTTIGFSSSKLIHYTNTKKEDKERSRRVEFRVITNAEIEINRVVKKLRDY